MITVVPATAPTAHVQSRQRDPTDGPVLLRTVHHGGNREPGARAAGALSSVVLRFCHHEWAVTGAGLPLSWARRGQLPASGMLRDQPQALSLGRQPDRVDQDDRRGRRPRSDVRVATLVSGATSLTWPVVLGQDGDAGARSRYPTALRVELREEGGIRKPAPRRLGLAAGKDPPRTTLTYMIAMSMTTG